MSKPIDYDSVLLAYPEELEALGDKAPTPEETMRCVILMLTALVARAGGHITVTKDEMDAAMHTAVMVGAVQDGSGNAEAYMHDCPHLAEAKAKLS